MSDSASSRVRLAGLSLDIRPGVAFRERPFRDGVLFYLSLFDDEIDSRLEQFLASAGLSDAQDAAAAMADPQAAGCYLELTDAVIFRGNDAALVVVRGGACTFSLFWLRDPDGIRVATSLPLASAPFSKTGFASAIAAVCLQGSYEPNVSLDTPLAGWSRFPRGAVTSAAAASCSVQPIADRDSAVLSRATPGALDTPDNEDSIADAVRAAFEGYARSQRAVRSSVLELSGGFDSTLAGAAALSPAHRMRGISVEFPYYEFRFESDVQQSVGTALGISRTVLDGTGLFPYAPWERPPRFDEPAVFVTGIRHAEQVAAFAAAHHASRIYVGHGGDQLFSTDLTASEVASPPPSSAAFSRQCWRAIRRAVAQVRQPLWLRRSTGCFVYDARRDVWIKETFGAAIRTPFADLAVFRAARRWSRWCASRRVRPDKTILALALPHLLPHAVTGRKGKVAYDGVWMRAYAAHAQHIAETIGRVAPVLDHVGISSAWLLRRVARLADWQPVPDREVLAAYAVSAWLASWGIERVSDVSWSNGSAALCYAKLKKKF